MMPGLFLVAVMVANPAPRTPRPTSCDGACDQMIELCQSRCKKNAACTNRCARNRARCVTSCNETMKAQRDRRGPSIANLPPAECLRRCQAAVDSCVPGCQKLKNDARCLKSCKLMAKNCPAFCKVDGAKWGK